MADKPAVSSDLAQRADWNAAGQNLLSATLSASCATSEDTAGLLGISVISFLSSDGFQLLNVR